jgi:DoxX-like family
MGAAKSIYVQIDIRGPIDRVWELTQVPEFHEKWDLRFTEIEYLPRPDAAQPQRFLYATRLGFGIGIRGEGESVGSRDGPDGVRTSALKFWSDDRKSLIRVGSGYWKYVPSDEAQSVRFLTGYDYTVRFGAAGRGFDRLVFRPLIGWATAWSFDRLRLWIEKGIEPALSAQRSVIHAIARLALAFVWLYEGLVPKLIFRHRDEIAMLRSLGLSESSAGKVCAGVGWAEVALGLALLLAWRSRWPLWVTVVAMPLAAIGVALRSPQYLVAAFNPIALNVAVFALAAVALAGGGDLPSAGRCVRTPPRGKA